MLEWFNATHCLAPIGVTVRWQRVALPAGGGVGDQDAWLFDALEYARHVHELILHEDLERRDRAKAEKTTR